MFNLKKIAEYVRNAFNKLTNDSRWVIGRLPSNFNTIYAVSPECKIYFFNERDLKLNQEFIDLFNHMVLNLTDCKGHEILYPKLIKEQSVGNRSTTVEFSFESKGEDYYDPSVQALIAICHNLCGGHQEPKSKRDAVLGAHLYDFLVEYVGEDCMSQSKE